MVDLAGALEPRPVVLTPSGLHVPAPPDRLALVGVWRIRMRDAHTGRLLSDRTYRNTICANGKVYIAQWLNGELTALSMYGAVGTSGTAPTSADTQLGAELARVALASTSRSTNVATIDFFYTTSQGNGTWAEAGLFLGATGTANSGSMLSHVLCSEVKTSSITATLEFAIQIG